uniref:G-protein coupled receptors family 3 profile domain-containing protein n=1 Tax=Xenopus tropicalis TaxID=8364 RepID=A0A803KEK2_XENTR
ELPLLSGVPFIRYLVTDGICNYLVCFIINNKLLRNGTGMTCNHYIICEIHFILCFYTRFSTEYYQTMQALIFAVEEINSDPELLPQYTLGFQVFDSCFTLRKAAHGTLSLLSGGRKITPNYHCHKGAPVAGIIGDSGSSQSILMISYFATSPTLSDRNLFPSFFRTIPSDEFQMRGLAQLVSHFNWSWVGLLASDTDYGQFGLQMIKQEIVKGGACVAFAENIRTNHPDRNAPHLVQVIRKSTAKVVIVISSDFDFVIVADELLEQNVSGITWIASEAWATSELLSKEPYKGLLSGTVGVAIRRGQMTRFTKYINSLSPSENVNDLFIKEFWEEIFNCKWLNRDNVTIPLGNETRKACTGSEKLEDLLNEEYHRVSLNVYTAVYAFAWALHSWLNCQKKTKCLLLHYIKKVYFKTQDGSQIFFDAKGNPPAVYDIVNWCVNAKGALGQVIVGRYDMNAPETFNVDSDGVIWANGSTKVPLSKCSPSCAAGFRKVMVPSKALCCYECARCPQGQISNQTDAVECNPCSWDTWPNQHRAKCIARTTEFLSYEDDLGLILAPVSILSSLVPLVFWGVFVHYKKTPIVRANNYSLSCLLLLSLFLCFLCSLGFIGYPQPEKCLLRQVAFGMVFALCISCVLAKTITVVIAFNATKPGSRLRKWTGVRLPYFVIILCTFIQFSLCMIWLIFYPPVPELNTETKPGIIIVSCNEGSPTAFWCMLGYLGLLATISFIVAFLARRLPDSFNEAKLITFSMLAFLSVWVSFIPAYLSARGMYTVAMEVFAILSSSWAVVGCIFVPKCFIVLFRPNMNSREHLMGKRNIYNFS